MAENNVLAAPSIPVETISGSGGAIDFRIEAALDMVKSHLMSAVRGEVEDMREKITRLEESMTRLKVENELLREHVPREILDKEPQLVAQRMAGILQQLQAKAQANAQPIPQGMPPPQPQIQPPKAQQTQVIQQSPQSAPSTTLSSLDMQQQQAQLVNQLIGQINMSMHQQVAQQSLQKALQDHQQSRIKQQQQVLVQPPGIVQMSQPNTLPKASPLLPKATHVGAQQPKPQGLAPGILEQSTGQNVQPKALQTITSQTGPPTAIVGPVPVTAVNNALATVDAKVGHKTGCLVATTVAANPLVQPQSKMALPATPPQLATPPKIATPPVPVTPPQPSTPPQLLVQPQQVQLQLMPQVQALQAAAAQPLLQQQSTLAPMISQQ